MIGHHGLDALKLREMDDLIEVGGVVIGEVIDRHYRLHAIVRARERPHQRPHPPRMDYVSR